MNLWLCPHCRRVQRVISSWTKSRRIESTSKRRGYTRTCPRSNISSSKSYWQSTIVSGQHRCRIDVREYQWIKTKPLLGNQGFDSLWLLCRSRSPNLGQQAIEWALRETHRRSGYRNENGQPHRRATEYVRLGFALSLSMGKARHSSE